MDKKTFKQILLIVSYGIVLYLLLTNLSILTDALSLIRRVFASFIYGLFIAYLLNIPYKAYREKLFVLAYRKGGVSGRITKYLAMLMAYITVLIILAVLVWIIIPQLVISLTLLIQNVPYYIESLEVLLTRIGSSFGQENFYQGQLDTLWPSIINWSNRIMNDVISNFAGYFSSLTTHIYNWIIAIAFSVYLISGKEVLLEQSRAVIRAYMSRKRGERFIQICSQTNRIFNNFIAGNILDSLLVGALCFIGMNLLNMPYPLLISVIIGVTNLIPIVGPFIGAIPGSMIILTVEPIKAVFFALFILVLQQVDGNIFKPKIFGNKIGLPSVWVLLSIVVLGGLFGMFGMLIGVPVFGVLYALFREAVMRRLAEKNKRPINEDEPSLFDTVFNVSEAKLNRQAETSFPQSDAQTASRENIDGRTRKENSQSEAKTTVSVSRDVSVTEKTADTEKLADVEKVVDTEKATAKDKAEDTAKSPGEAAEEERSKY